MTSFDQVKFYTMKTYFILRLFFFFFPTWCVWSVCLFWELLILGGLIVFSCALWQRYDWRMHLMLQAVTWRDLHLDCWCFAGCIFQLCVFDCAQLKQSDIHWCVSTCLGCDCNWKRVSLSKCTCLFVFVACTLLHIHHISTRISHLYAWQIMSAHTQLWKADSVCWCQAPACYRDYTLTFFLLWYPKDQQIEAGILRRIWGFPLSFSTPYDEGCWKSVWQETKNSAVLKIFGLGFVGLFFKLCNSSDWYPM